MNIQDYSVAELKAALYAKLERPMQINGPEDIVNYLSAYAAEVQEYFLVITIDNHNKVIQKHEVSKGARATTIIDPCLIFRAAVVDSARSIIVAHNHPSGAYEPSPQDVEVTEKLVKGGKILDIPVLDHIIISSSGYYSFANNGRI